jgi:hypothetical protein
MLLDWVAGDQVDGEGDMPRWVYRGPREKSNPQTLAARGRALMLGLMGLCLLISFGVSHAVADVNQLKSVASETFKVLRLQGNLVRWQRPFEGGSAEITYRVLTGPQPFSNAHSCRDMTAFDDLLSASGIAHSTLDSELATAFAMWGAVTSLRFRNARTGEPASIVIGALVYPKGWAFTDVIPNTDSPQHIKPILQALICLNPKRRWKVGFDGDLKVFDLRYTFAHEIGHAIGLDHPTGPGQIMDRGYEERFSDLQPGDVTGATKLYSTSNAPN